MPVAISLLSFSSELNFFGLELSHFLRGRTVQSNFEECLGSIRAVGVGRFCRLTHAFLIESSSGSNMEKLLSQEEIDAMVRNARGARREDAPTTKLSIEPCSFRQSTQLAGEQARAISGLLETFARNLTQSLGAYLSVPFEAKLASVEQLSYGEFLERMPQITYMISLFVSPMRVSAALQIDNSLVFPLIDILLGGIGQCKESGREVSEIEEQIIEDVAGVVCRDLNDVLEPLGTKLELERRQSSAQVQRFRPPTERTLCVSLEVKLAEVRGTMNLVLPTAVSNPLVRRLLSGTPAAASRIPPSPTPTLKERMLQCSFLATLELTAIELSIEEVLSLSPGGVYNLRVPASRAASLLIAGRELFTAAPVRQRSLRAAQLGEPIAVFEEERRS